MNQRQLQVIDYLREENRVLREQLGDRRLRLDDSQRRRSAVKAKVLGRRVLAQIATIVTPETLLAWHRFPLFLPYGLSVRRQTRNHVCHDRLPRRDHGRTGGHIFWRLRRPLELGSPGDR